MPAPIKRLKKKDIIWLATHRCKHYHNYLDHFNCYLREEDPDFQVERIGFFDIEASNLNANFGFIISYAIKPSDSSKIIECYVNRDDIATGEPDRRLLEQLNTDLQKFDRLVVYYGSNGRFDIPYCRTRALHYGIPFPEIKTRFVTDLYPIVKNKCKFHSNRLQVACDFFNIPAKDHPLRPDIWIKAMTGDKAAIDFIRMHNREDVLSTEALYYKLFPHMLLQESSI